MFFITVTMLVMALQAVAMKSVSHLMPLWQITVLRSLLVVIALLVGYAIFQRFKWPRRANTFVYAAVAWKPLLSRSLLMVLMNFLYYGSLPLLDVSTAAAAYYISPILTFLLAIVFLKERINLIAVSAIILGFFGAFRIINPGGDVFTLLVLLPMLSALAYSAASVITRGLCQACSPLVLSLGVHIAFLVCGSIASAVTYLYPAQLRSLTNYDFLTKQWVEMNASLWLIVLVLAVFNMATHLGFAKSYQVAQASVIAPLEYTYLLFIGVLAYIVFSEVPSSSTVQGMVLIICAGILLIYKDGFMSKSA